MRHAFGKGTLSGIALEDGKNQAVVVVLPWHQRWQISPSVSCRKSEECDHVLHQITLLGSNLEESSFCSVMPLSEQWIIRWGLGLISHEWSQRGHIWRTWKRRRSYLSICLCFL
jgi:hypothetical protein